MRQHVVQILDESASRSDAQVFAFAVMENHLHIVARQQQDPISQLMQPALRRIALMLQRECGIEGHAFERRFRLRPCLSAGHLRDAIVYTHLNPVRAGMCTSPGDADCTSHSTYVTEAPGLLTKFTAFMRPACELFASNRDTTPDQARRRYCEYLAYRLQCDEEDRAGVPRSLTPPDTSGGDMYFAKNFVSEDRFENRTAVRADLRDIALRVIAVQHTGLPLRQLRGANISSRELQRLRHTIIRQAYAAGHPGVKIAAFFAMSPSRVSEIARAD